MTTIDPRYGHASSKTTYSFTLPVGLHFKSMQCFDGEGIFLLKAPWRFLAESKCADFDRSDGYFQLDRKQ